MNNDLISRNALFKTWDALDETQDPNLLVDAMIKSTQEAPTIDAEPVRHGRWINKTMPIYASLDYRFECSVCKHIFYAGGIETFKYCPWCGAKMDAEVEG